MWRRGPFNPTMPVPSHQGGVEAHLHSPRRGSGLDSNTSSSSGYASVMPGMSNIQTSSFLGTMPNTQAFLQRGGMGEISSTSSNYTNPQNHLGSGSTSYIDWASSSNNFGSVGQSQNLETGKSNHNGSTKRRVHRDTSKVSGTDTSMSGYNRLSSGNASQYITDLQHLNFAFPGTSGSGDADTSTATLKVATNTPTTLAGQSFVDELLAESNNHGTPGHNSSDLFSHSN
ncbi:uncharacterized protein BCR38DRAFT_523014, partial [Pseudomassariella vexata]